MQVEMILETVKKEGGKLAVINGGLKAKSLTELTRRLVKSHKTEIIQLLIKPPTEPNLKPCPLCKGLDFIHGHNGCYFCINCQPEHKGTSVKAGGKRLDTDIKGNTLGSDKPEAKYSTPVRINRGKQSDFFLVAHKWILRHRLDLLSAGWNPSELYRRNKSRGIAWMKIWGRPGLIVAVGRSGEIVFRFKNTAKKSVQQTAFPRRDYGNK